MLRPWRPALRLSLFAAFGRGTLEFPPRTGWPDSSHGASQSLFRRDCKTSGEKSGKPRSRSRRTKRVATVKSAVAPGLRRRCFRLASNSSARSHSSLGSSAFCESAYSGAASRCTSRREPPVRPADPSRAGATQCEASARLADRKTQAAESSPEFAVEVEEAEVQTSRHRDRHAGRRSCMQKVHCGPAWPLFPSAPICACRNRVRVYNVFDEGLWQAPAARPLAEWKVRGVVEWPKKRPSEHIRRKKSPRDCSAIFRIGVTKAVGFVGNIRRIAGRAR